MKRTPTRPPVPTGPRRPKPLRPSPIPSGPRGERPLPHPLAPKGFRRERPPPRPLALTGPRSTGLPPGLPLCRASPFPSLLRRPNPPLGSSLRESSPFPSLLRRCRPLRWPASPPGWSPTIALSGCCPRMRSSTGRFPFPRRGLGNPSPSRPRGRRGALPVRRSPRCQMARFRLPLDPPLPACRRWCRPTRPVPPLPWLRPPPRLWPLLPRFPLRLSPHPPPSRKASPVPPPQPVPPRAP